jgi:hypothetical protein
MVNFDAVKQAVKCGRLLADLGIHQVSQHNGYDLYHSPLRQGDDKPSFSVYADGTKWKDHGTGDYGDVIDLAVKLGLAKFPRKAAELLAERYGVDAAPRQRVTAPIAKTASSAPPTAGNELISVGAIQTSSLRRYLDERAIPFNIANYFFREVHYRVPSGKEMYGIGLQTLAGGYAVRSAFGNFKTVVGLGGISLIGGVGKGPVAAFEGMFDLASWLVDTEGHEGDAVVLNSVANVDAAISAMKPYDRIKCYLDRDVHGAQALLSIKQAFPGKVQDRSSRYEGYKDYNEFLVNQLRNEKDCHPVK